MSKPENYPDNIRDYDNVPGSPFYQDPEEGLDDEIEAIRFDLKGILDRSKHGMISKLHDIEPSEGLNQLAETHDGIVALDAALDDLAE